MTDNKLHQVLNTIPSQVLDQFEKAYKKIFGIPAELEDHDGSIIFNTHGEKFSLDYEGTLLWYRKDKWHRINDLEGARRLWQS
jgi:hypothetical protein